MKKKLCKGSGKAILFKCCGNVKYIFKYGLCKECYGNWLYNTKEGKELIKKSIFKAKKEFSTKIKKEIREKKKELMTKSEYEKKLQTIINSIVRIIDFDKGCISCNHGWDKPFTRQRHAGHRYAVGSNPQLRFNLFNIWCQCSICNNILSGNEREYDKGIIKHYGSECLSLIEQIKSTYQVLKLTIPEIEEAIIKATIVKKQLLSGESFSRYEINEKIGIYKR